MKRLNLFLITGIMVVTVMSGCGKKEEPSVDTVAKTEETSEVVTPVDTTIEANVKLKAEAPSETTVTKIQNNIYSSPLKL